MIGAPSRRALLCAAYYLLAYFFTFPLIVLLKEAGGDGVGVGTLDFGSCFLNPLAFLVLGYYYGKWPGVLSHGLCIFCVHQVAKPAIAQLVGELGLRGASYVWPRYLPYIYFSGWVISTTFILWRARSRSSQTST